MKNFYEILKKCPLFAGMDQAEIQELFACLSAKVRAIQKDEILISAGDKPEAIGVVLSGSVYVIQEDYWGNRTILTAIGPGSLFGEAFSCAQAESSPVSVVARQDGDVLMIDCKKILFPSDSCVLHSALLSNLMKVLASKNILLTQKIKHITKKTTREKVMSYLSECAVTMGRNSFEIPFNRQELADYLSVERSALSCTLSKMRKDGIIAYHKNKFQIL